MKLAKSLAIATALVVGASSLAMAQSSSGSGVGNTQQNAASSGGPGTHVGSVKTGTQANDQKVLRNQNGYQGMKQ